jgi:DNA repair exonuclease SbcCD ATPase subunit
VLQQVTVEGFGPFKNPVTYPLAGRGVVAVTGRNEDDAAAVSNGAGKTSLLTALLWAFKVRSWGIGAVVLVVGGGSCL